MFHHSDGVGVAMFRHFGVPALRHFNVAMATVAGCSNGEAFEVRSVAPSRWLSVEAFDHLGVVWKVLKEGGLAS
jgi:hypothetical protein